MENGLFAQDAKKMQRIPLRLREHYEKCLAGTSDDDELETTTNPQLGSSNSSNTEPYTSGCLGIKRKSTSGKL